MAHLTTCIPCLRGDHKHCVKSVSPPPGYFGGMICRCPCKGNPNWNNAKTRRKRTIKSFLKSIKKLPESK